MAYSSSDTCFDELLEVDEEFCLPVITDTSINLPDYMSTADRLHVNLNFVKARDKEEQAKSVARQYRDGCTKLMTQVAERKLKQAKLEAAFSNEKNVIRSFWRDQILEGQSRSGRIVKLALNT